MVNQLRTPVTPSLYMVAARSGMSNLRDGDRLNSPNTYAQPDMGEFVVFHDHNLPNCLRGRPLRDGT